MALTKPSEKTLEYNVGAELLTSLRKGPGLSRAYLRGLTQKEEASEGADAYATLPGGTQIYTFQFKAPKGHDVPCPAAGNPTVRYKLERPQHDLLYTLGSQNPGTVFYILPDYCCYDRFETSLPRLMRKTWLMDIGLMPTATVFGSFKTRTLVCKGSVARVNPEFTRVSFAQRKAILAREGVTPSSFASWLREAVGVSSETRKQAAWKASVWTHTRVLVARPS